MKNKKNGAKRKKKGKEILITPPQHKVPNANAIADSLLERAAW